MFITIFIPAPKSPNPRLTYIQKKREACPVHQKSGIAKRLEEVSEETIFPRCNLCIGMQNTYQVHIQIQNERHIVPILPLEIGDFDFSDKAKNAFLSIPAISPTR